MRAIIGLTLLTVSISSGQLFAADFVSRFDNTHDRIWIGAEYWANPVEDWRIHDGRLECVRGGENRNVHLLTRWLGSKKGDLNLSVRVGLLSSVRRQGSAGFAIGVLDSETQHHLSNLFFGSGLGCGITSTGVLFIGKLPEQQAPSDVKKVDDVELRLSAKPIDSRYRLTLSAHDPRSGKRLGSVVTRTVVAEQLVGNLVLVNNHAANRRPHVASEGRMARFWFRDWKVSGSKLLEDDDERFGPILYALHTLSRGVMKMTAQMPPMGAKESQSVQLQIQTDGWKTIANQEIDPLSRTATFRVADWDDKRDIPYRLIYKSKKPDGSKYEDHFVGTVRKDPVNKDEIVVAGFTGNTDSGFPNELVRRNVAIIDPDILFFSGDQIYESVGGYGIFRQPVELATVNYLRKIWMWGWSFRDLMRDRPTLVLPDDHDVYQGNIWGQNGRNCDGMRNHARGGYAMPAAWINAIQRTQNAHHPDPFDPTPVEQDIGVYYGDMVYGRISLAVLEDRKFKSGPQDKVNSWQGRPDHVTDSKLDPKSLDKPGLKLLGDRQLKFLRHWSGDWKGADMKMAVSQTIFCNLANYHGRAQTFLVADLDSNGWPQAGRNRALAELRRGHAFHFAGDQHLPSIVQHGIDTWGDAGFSFCVPSIAAGYPRSWRPDVEGRPVQNRARNGLANTGDYRDGLGNRVTVHAIGNPAKKNRRGRINKLHDKASGFGIVRMNKSKGTITMECYRLQIDAANLKPTDQFPGWPKTVRVTDNYGRVAKGYLPELQISGLRNPVIQVTNEKTKELVYSLRFRGAKFRPKVFDSEATYSIRVGDPDSQTWQTINSIRVQSSKIGEPIDVAF